MRSEIKKLPDGVYYGHSTLDGDGLVDEPIEIRVKITIQGDEALVDFEGSSPQVKGPSNSPKANTDTCVYVAFLTTVTTPDIPHNEGVYRPITITAPEGSVVNSNFPAPVAYCTLDTACAILEACWMALSEILPGRVPAGWSRWNGPAITGVDPRNENFYVMFGFNGFGGAGGARGMDGRHYIGDGIDLGGLIAPNVETNEVDYPHITEFNEFTTDSCGAGEYRGGCGAQYRIRFYDGAETDLIMFGDGREHAPYGLFDGKEGSLNMAYLNEGMEGEELLPSKGVSHVSGAGTFSSYPSGGGGWGNPKKRPAETVALDAKNGYISKKSAHDVYGVALNDDYTVQEEATRALRG
jgi:N-methylhydantoinase B